MCFNQKKNRKSGRSHFLLRKDYRKENGSTWENLAQKIEFMCWSISRRILYLNIYFLKHNRLIFYEFVDKMGYYKSEQKKTMLSYKCYHFVFIKIIMYNVVFGLVNTINIYWSEGYKFMWRMGESLILKCVLSKFF